MRRLITTLMLFGLLPLTALAQAQHAVVLLKAQGGSGTVVATGPGWTLLTSSHHMFPGGRVARPITFDVPAPAAWTCAAATVPAAVIAFDGPADVVLIRAYWGPAPYVAPVAPAGYVATVCLSVGYDEMRQPPQVRPARVVRTGGSMTYTRERPWHGRSGGALLSGPYLVGVVSGYTGPRNHQETYPGAEGVYTSHAAVLRLLAGAGGGPRSAPPPAFQGLPRLQAQPLCPT